MSDNVTRPKHYMKGGIEAIDGIEAALAGYDCPVHAFLAGQVLKYMWRSPLKGKQLEDLRKAEWYLDRLIAKVEPDDG